MLERERECVLTYSMNCASYAFFWLLNSFFRLTISSFDASDEPREFPLSIESRYWRFINSSRSVFTRRKVSSILCKLFIFSSERDERKEKIPRFNDIIIISYIWDISLMTRWLVSRRKISPNSHLLLVFNVSYMFDCISFVKLFSSAFWDLSDKFSTSSSCFCMKSNYEIELFGDVIINSNYSRLPSQEDRKHARWPHTAEARHCSSKIWASRARLRCFACHFSSPLAVLLNGLSLKIS